jgi:hypothetical protein
VPKVEKLKKPKDWLFDKRRRHPRGKRTVPQYAAFLHPMMEGQVTYVWPLKTLLRRLYDKEREEGLSIHTQAFPKKKG